MIPMESSGTNLFHYLLALLFLVMWGGVAVACFWQALKKRPRLIPGRSRVRISPPQP